ncbi:MAG: hypothetical protein COX77_00320 [Candidatus Komeilibacteria bacterium CG_4_10_14_0_2_um_filter_37_10]|uniref:EamA domain-containing protein n=1 Tax=Candidatus Komeilibacteria bacterium CG_4_10_14_0_2_um_filter_37_10 TaxID=1974470 RepID=A0A2M7VGJ1_9BACT|nr:MAG: hypothetical protein COX77_00320 [Candidatus Komeilibacteria bacterium CG_4_10_14_0_2_um_filter_37_10]
MGWLSITIIGYFFNSISIIIDKSLLNKQIPHPVVYTFYISILGLVAFLLAPFGLHLISVTNFIYSIISGFFFTWALLAMFSALLRSEASRVTPLIGSFSPLFILALSYFIVGERLSLLQVMAFVLIFLGSVLISYRRHYQDKHVKSIWLAILSAFLFALSYVIAKYVFDEIGFISGFVWARIGSFIAAIILLIPQDNRRVIKANFSHHGGGAAPLMIMGQVAGALSSILVNVAISLGSVTLVNALQGLNYAFLFFMVLILGKWHPEWLREELNKEIIIQKVIAIFLIIVGLYLIV